MSSTLLNDEQVLKYITLWGKPDKHFVSDIYCEACYNGNYPQRCKCGGLIHAILRDEDSDEYPIDLYRRCDRCDSKYESI